MNKKYFEDELPDELFLAKRQTTKIRTAFAKKKKHNKIVLLGKDTLNAIEVVISKAPIKSCISHDNIVSVNNVLKDYNEIKEEISKS